MTNLAIVEAFSNLPDSRRGAGQLQPWLDLTDEVRKLQIGEPLRVDREL